MMYRKMQLTNTVLLGMFREWIGWSFSLVLLISITMGFCVIKYYKKWYVQSIVLCSVVFVLVVSISSMAFWFDVQIHIASTACRGSFKQAFHRPSTATEKQQLAFCKS